MNILYGINTNGQGHVNRARTIIEILESEGHKVDLLFDGPQPPRYVKDFPNKIHYIQGYVVKYKHHKVNYGKTFIDNFVDTMNTFPSKIYKLELLTRLRNYDLIISDLEIMTSLLGFRTKLPTISIDHQHSLLHPSSVKAPGEYKDLISAITAIYLTSPWKNHYIAIDYTDKIINDGKSYGTLFPLFKKNDLNNVKTTNMGHICTYLSFMNVNEIYNVFKEFPEQIFYVFGHDKNLTKNNVHFMPTSRNNFLDYLISSKGVISNSGFSLTWETIQLDKQILCIPYGNQYEQTINAYRLKKLGAANVSKVLTVDSVDSFLKTLEGNNRKIKKLPILDPKILINLIEKTYQDIIS